MGNKQIQEKGLRKEFGGAVETGEEYNGGKNIEIQKDYYASMHFDIEPALAQKIAMDMYDVICLIGKGTFGKVFLVQNKEDMRVFALKVLKKQQVVKTLMVENTMAERRILEKMEHPFIVTLRYAFQTKDKLFMLFDYINGGELFFHLKNCETFEIERAKFYAAEIVIALCFLHSKGILYRDLKPENVLLGADGHVKLTDFGLAKQLKSHLPQNSGEMKANSFCGTAEYLAPELIRGENYGASVDWWSLAILLYEMITGWPPFEDENSKNNLYAKIVSEDPDFSDPKFSPEGRDLLSKMLEKKVEDRIDVEKMKSHKFFENINWDKLYRKELEPPFVPVVSSPTSLSYIDPEFTNQGVGTLTPQQGETIPGDAFGGFTYLPANSIDATSVIINKVYSSRTKKA